MCQGELHIEKFVKAGVRALTNGVRSLLCCMTLIWLAVAAGCSENGISPETTSGENGGQAGPAPASEGGNRSASGGTTVPAEGAVRRGRDEIYVDENGQKWFGNVPWDVFFDDPHAVASNQTPVGGGASLLASNSSGAPLQADSAGSGNPGSAVTPPVNASPQPSQGTPANSSTGSSSTNGGAGSSGSAPEGWADLISGAVLMDEVKGLRNFLNETLQSVGNYNSSMLMIPPKAAALGVLAGIAMEHPDSISWKEDAAYIRDLAKQMNASPLQRGAKDQKRLLALFESIDSILNRSRPAGLEEPPAGDSFADVSEMRLVMMRMEESEKRMKTEIGSAAAFMAQKSMVQHEAAVLASMTRTVTLPGYGYEDDPEFVGYGRAIIEAAEAISSSAETGDFASFEVALSKVTTTCQTCHTKYKND